jgi:hypothetical protein
MSAGDSGPPYRLSLVGHVRHQIRRLYQLAVMMGVRDEFTQTMTGVDSALRTQPTTWGTPVEVLHTLRMTKYRRVLNDVRIEYTVHQDVSNVWLTHVSPTRTGKLWIGEG